MNSSIPRYVIVMDNTTCITRALLGYHSNCSLSEGKYTCSVICLPLSAKQNLRRGEVLNKTLIPSWSKCQMMTLWFKVWIWSNFKFLSFFLMEKIICHWGFFFFFGCRCIVASKAIYNFYWIKFQSFPIILWWWILISLLIDLFSWNRCVLFLMTFHLHHK